MESGIVSFGVFEVDVQTGEVYRLGRLVPLQEQPTRILSLLLEHPGEIVTREQLRRAIWGDDVHVDFDRSLNTGIARLRESLGDSSSHPLYIETVPRKGYRFIAPLNGVPEDSSQPIAPPVPPAPWRRWLWLGLALGAAAAGATAFLLLRPTVDDPPSDLAPERLTYYEGLESEATFSPDGSQVAFTWTGEDDDNLDVYVKTVGASNRIRLTRHPLRDFSPAWSPNGAWIAFLRERGDGRADVVRVPAIGGREHRLFDVAFPQFRLEGGRSIPDRHLSWSPDSESLAVVDHGPTDEAASLYVFSTTTGMKHRLTQAPRGSGGDRNPAFSSDGRRLAFTGSRRKGATGAYLLELTEGLDPDGEPELLMRQISIFRGIAWGRGDRELLVTAQAGLWSVDIGDPAKRRRLQFADSAADLPAFSKAAARLGYTEKAGVANIWRVELDGERAARAPERVMSSTGGDGNLQLSPDGERIAFMSWRSGKAEIWVASSDGANAASLGDRYGGTPRWSPNNESIVFDSRSAPQDFDILMISTRGGPARRFTQGPEDDHSPSWSRDGEWIYFARNSGEGWQVWKKRVDNGRTVQVTRNGGFYSEESIDSRFVYYTKGLRDFTVWRAPAFGGEEVQVLEAVSTWNNFAVTGDGIYYTPRRGPDGTSPILFHDFADESVREVHRPERPISNGLSVSPDGRLIYYAQIDWDGSDLMLVEGFR